LSLCIFCFLELPFVKSVKYFSSMWHSFSFTDVFLFVVNWYIVEWFLIFILIFLSHSNHTYSPPWFLYSFLLI
jgi:hypothetical protein